MAAQTDDKKLDGAGLSVLWGLIKNIIPTVPTNVSAFTNDASYVSLLDTHNKNLVLASPSGAAGLPSFRALVAEDIPDLSGTYLTSHQSIKSLTLQGDGTTVSTFTANSAALTFNFKAGSNISLTRGTNEITIANTYSYSHPTGGANTTIAAANGKVLSAITVNNLGHVTSVSSKTLAAADIPDLSATYLTSHQTIYALKIQGDGTDVTTYTPNSATKTFNLKGGSNISLTRGTNEITIANTYSYSHPTGGANTTISAANGKVLSAITVNNLGHVTSVSSKTLSTSDIPDLSASYISTSGGGITSGSNTPLSLTSTTNYCKIFFVNSAHNRTIGISSSGRFFVSNIDGQSNEYQIWHAGNDGAGSGLDADKLDGQEGSYYATASWAQNRDGYGTCSTNATTAAKTVSISNFVLTKNSIVSVYFEKGVDVVNATLNVSSTGAKYIHNMGVVLQPYVIRPRMTVTFLYDGTSWNIISLQGLEQSASGENYIDLGLPSGLKWARTNIDLSTASKFAASPYQNTCTFFSWGNNFGYNPVNGAFSNYTWNQTNYNTTGGSKLNGNVAPSFDAARANLGAPWRIPTEEEWKELYDNCDFLDANGNVISASTTDKRCLYNGYYGIRMRSKNNNAEIFFTCCGYGYDNNWSVNSGLYSQGRYWSATYKNGSEAYKMNATINGVSFKNSDNKFEGFPIRPVF